MNEAYLKNLRQGSPKVSLKVIAQPYKESRYLSPIKLNNGDQVLGSDKENPSP